MFGEVGILLGGWEQLVYGLGLGAGACVIGWIVYYIYAIFVDIYHINKHLTMRKNSIKKRDEWLAQGNRHKWIKLPVHDAEHFVCEKTLYCPSLDDFITEESFSLYMKQQRIDEEFKNFVKKKIHIVAEQYKIDVKTVIAIVNDIDDCKFEFTKKNAQRYTN